MRSGIRKLAFRPFLAIPAGGAALSVAGPAAAEAHAPYYYGHMYGLGGGLLGLGMMVLFWGGIIVLVVLAVRWLSGREAPPAGRSDAIEILRERLARGEIDAEEYQARRRVLES